MFILVVLVWGVAFILLGFRWPKLSARSWHVWAPAGREETRKWLATGPLCFTANLCCDYPQMSAAFYVAVYSRSIDQIVVYHDRKWHSGVRQKFPETQGNRSDESPQAKTLSNKSGTKPRYEKAPSAFISGMICDQHNTSILSSCLSPSGSKIYLGLKETNLKCSHIGVLIGCLMFFYEYIDISWFEHLSPIFPYNGLFVAKSNCGLEQYKN